MTEFLWSEAVEHVIQQLTPEDRKWLYAKENQEPLTGAQLFQTLEALRKDATKSTWQKFFAKIDPIISHINSFAAAISTAVQANPVGAGLIWSSIYFLLLVAGRTMSSLETALQFLWELGPHLSLFTRWHALFPDKNFGELRLSIKEVYIEVVCFCVKVAKKLKKHILAQMLQAIVRPSIEIKFKKSMLSIQRSLARVKSEVDTAHMKSMQTQLATLNSTLTPIPLSEGPLPSIRLIPHTQNHRFAGRRKILEHMKNKLLRRSVPKQHTFALHGPSGSGKTQIALAYTYNQLTDYKSIIWILADTREKIDQGFRDAADLLGLENNTQNVNRAKAFVLQRLNNTDDRFLLCFDNADDYKLIQDAIPRSANGTIIITSRDAVASEDLASDAIPVPEFTPEEAEEYMKRALPQTAATPEYHAALKEISGLFFGYPLALSQAAAFVRSGGCTLPMFMTVVQDKRSSAAISHLPVSDYHTTLDTVWELSVSKLDDYARRILFTLVFMDPDRIPYSLFKRTDADITGDAAALLEFYSDHVKFIAALTKLRSQSLIGLNSQAGTLSIHRFIQDRAARHLDADPEAKKTAFHEAMQLLKCKQPEFPNVYSHWSPSCWPASSICQPHIKRLFAQYLISPAVFSGYEGGVSKLLYECASYEFETYATQTATETYEHAREVAQKAQSPNPLLISDCYRMEGRMYNESGDPVPAIHSNEQATIFAEQAVAAHMIDDNDARLPRIITGLGNSLSQLNKFDEALALQVEAMGMCRRITGRRADAITIVQLNWGFLLCRRGELDEAEQVLRQCLDADPDTPPALYALGNTYLAQGRANEALAAHARGLQIYQSKFGHEHALVGRAAYKCGEIILLHGKDAKQAMYVLIATMHRLDDDGLTCNSIYLQRAFDICCKQSTYYRTKGAARAARMLAKAFQADKQHAEAGKYFDMAWDLRQSYTGERGGPNDTDEDYREVMFYWDQ